MNRSSLLNSKKAGLSSLTINEIENMDETNESQKEDFNPRKIKLKHATVKSDDGSYKLLSQFQSKSSLNNKDCLIDKYTSKKNILTHNYAN